MPRSTYSRSPSLLVETLSSQPDSLAAETHSQRKAMAVEVIHIFLVVFFVIIMYFAWMDVALYYNLQSQHGNLLLTQNYAEEAKRRILQSGVANNKTSTPASTHPTAPLISTFDPFNPISIKLLVLDHPNHYIYYPLGSWLDIDILRLSEKLTFITPDMISWTHVVVAGFASKFLASEMLTHRRVGFLLFELRSFLDSLDGLVARSRSRQRAMIADRSHWGFWMDGICDLFGTIFFMVAVLCICQRCVPRRVVNFHVRPFIFKYLPASTKKYPILADAADQEPFLPTASSIKPRVNVISFRQSTVIVASLSLLMFLSSYFWNRYMEQYHLLLEVPMSNVKGNAEKLQLDTITSAPFWIIVWSWRLLNPHALMSVLLAAIFFDKAIETFVWIQFLGFLPLIGLASVSEVHMQATAWKLWYISH